MKDTKTIQMLASVSLIGGPLSIIIGGVVLSTAALVCGIIALVMVRGNKAVSPEASSDAILQALTRQATIGIAVSGIALVMNAATLVMMLPALIDAVQSGDYSSLLAGDASTGGPSGSDAADSGGAFGGSSDGSGSQNAGSGKSSIWG